MAPLFSPYDLFATSVWILICHVFEFERMCQCAVYMFLAQLAVLSMDGATHVVQAWQQIVQDGLRDT